MDENETAYNVIGAAIEVHRLLGPGLLESAYQTCLARELRDRGLQYEREVPVPVMYKGEFVSEAYRLDFIVQNNVLVELKAVEKLNDIHKAQLLTYLRLSKRKLGLLINFNAIRLKEGVVRVVNQL